ncbi:MAG: leuD1 [Solirubrobacterales bacterium]|jgi:3-isopropylmalate/(R)-2-methylmalate dehydratase small subunit|nr:leuD1 [Solirubrobacterales bacterium]
MTIELLEGSAWVFGDSIDTDNMYPGFAMKLSMEEAAKHVFYDLRPGWSEAVQPGDIVVAGRNFGIGSSRPVAQLFKQLGVVALVAEEFNSLFFRNSINFGLPAVTIPGVTATVGDGDRVRLDVSAASIERVADAQTLEGVKLPDFVLDIVGQGGLMAKLAGDGYLPAGVAGTPSRGGS